MANSITSFFQRITHRTSDRETERDPIVRIPLLSIGHEVSYAALASSSPQPVAPSPLPPTPTSVRNVRHAKIKIEVNNVLTGEYTWVRSANGQEVARFKNPGVCYAGEFNSDGQFQGFGSLQVPSRSGQAWKYTGEFENGKFHVQGIFAWESGDRYEGSFENGQFHGPGIFAWKSGDRYEGSFEKGQFHGQGIFTRKNGDRYEGSFEKGQFHGQGMFTDKNGSKAEGRFENGQFKNGRMNYANGTTYEGSFDEKGQIQNGKMNYANGRTYEGSFDEKEQFQNGKMNYANGITYEGSFENKQRHGQGTFTFANGDVFIGRFVDDKRRNGMMTFNKNDVWISYTGEFGVDPQSVDGSTTFHGQGTLTFKDGRIQEGKFEYGTFID